MKKDKNNTLSLQCCTVALPDFNQLLAKFIQSCYLQLMLMLLRDSLNLSQWSSALDCYGARAQEKRS